jgi:hypothetical protein
LYSTFTGEHSTVLDPDPRDPRLSAGKSSIFKGSFFFTESNIYHGEH